MTSASSTDGCWIGVVRPRQVQSPIASDGLPADREAAKGPGISMRVMLKGTSNLPEKSGRKCTEAALEEQAAGPGEAACTGRVRL